MVGRCGGPAGYCCCCCVLARGLGGQTGGEEGAAAVPPLSNNVPMSFPFLKSKASGRFTRCARHTRPNSRRAAAIFLKMSPSQCTEKGRAQRHAPHARLRLYFNDREDWLRRRSSNQPTGRRSTCELQRHSVVTSGVSFDRQSGLARTDKQLRSGGLRRGPRSRRAIQFRMTERCAWNRSVEMILRCRSPVGLASGLHAPVRPGRSNVKASPAPAPGAEERLKKPST